MSRQEGFYNKLRKGFLCIHPTDTIPGLTFDPKSTAAYQSLIEVKQRSGSQSVIGLCRSAASAFSYFCELSESWKTVLDKIWPAPLTVIYKASRMTPENLCSELNETAIRVPILDLHDQWLFDVMEKLEAPLPSTSVNISGNPSLVTTRDLKEFSEQFDNVYFDEGLFQNLKSEKKELKPSTIIRILNNDKFEVIREGAFSSEALDDLLKRYR